MERDDSGFIAATLAVVIAFAVAAWARKSAEGKWTWNVLVITQGVHARASLSKLQFFVFTLAVLWEVVAVLTSLTANRRLPRRRPKILFVMVAQNSGRA